MLDPQRENRQLKTCDKNTQTSVNSRPYYFLAERDFYCFRTDSRADIKEMGCKDQTIPCNRGLCATTTIKIKDIMERLCVLAFDQMKIKSAFEYDKTDEWYLNYQLPQPGTKKIKIFNFMCYVYALY